MFFHIFLLNKDEISSGVRESVLARGHVDCMKHGRFISRLSLGKKILMYVCNRSPNAYPWFSECVMCDFSVIVVLDVQISMRR